MNSLKKTLSLLLTVFVLIGCSGKQESHLEMMAISGDVVKVETIVQSSIPLTEMFVDTFDPESAFSMYSGNVSIEFDDKGNVEHSVGYGIDGKVLFEKTEFNPDNDGSMSFGIPIVLGGRQEIDRIEYEPSEDDKVVNAKYYSKDELGWSQTATYNDDGTINRIIKNYEAWTSGSYADTTTYNYLSFDNMNNWTEVEVDYKGVMRKHAHSYRVLRQLTYSNESEKEPLISRLQEYNQTPAETTSNVKTLRLGHYGTIGIPDYMECQSDDWVEDTKRFAETNSGPQLSNLVVSVYGKDDAYASFSVNLVRTGDTVGFDNMSPEEMEYDEEMDMYMEMQNTMELEKGGIRVLKWLPYEFTSLSGKRALINRYYRYGKGSPIPVYCENYTVPMSDGYSLLVNFSFQSNLDYRFRTDFVNAVNSIKL